jgi:hypothetical protein
MCFVWISEQTAIISLYNINQTHSVVQAAYPVSTADLHTVWWLSAYNIYSKRVNIF